MRSVFFFSGYFSVEWNKDPKCPTPGMGRGCVEAVPALAVPAPRAFPPRPLRRPVKTRWLWGRGSTVPPPRKTSRSAALSPAKRTFTYKTACPFPPTPPPTPTCSFSTWTRNLKTTPASSPVSAPSTDPTGLSGGNTSNVSYTNPYGFGNGTSDNLQVDLQELRISANISHEIFFTIGRQKVKYGAAKFINPTDFLNPVPFDFFLPSDERSGVDIVKMQIPSGTANLYAAGVAGNPTTGNHGFMLDGYPRTPAQAEFLDTQLAARGLAPPVVIHLDVPAEVLIGRMICRRECGRCGQMFNILSKRPKSPGRCDNCGGPLTVRTDDREEVIRERLSAYDAQTRPVLSHYYNGNYFHIPGDISTMYAFEAITHVLEPVVESEDRHMMVPRAS